MAPPILDLPSRPLSLESGVISNPKGLYWSLPVLLVLAVIFLIWQGPTPLHDITISQNPVEIADGAVQNGRCKTQRAIFTDCEAHLVYNYKGKSYESDVEMFFVDFHVGDYQTGVVISADQPQLATLGIGIDKLWDRIISLVVMELVLFGICIGAIFAALRAWNARRQLRYPAELVAIPVSITGFQKNRQGLFVTYADTISTPKTKRTGHTLMAPGDQPLIVGTAGGKAVALAVRHGTTSIPILLDKHLQRIEMTDAEREVALAPLVTSGILASAPDLASFKVQKKSFSIMRGVVAFFAMILLILVAAFGYWLWYVTSGDSQFNSPGMDINNMMPAPLNEWGCEQLKKRFGHDRAPFGCVAGDYTSWK